MFWGLIMEPNKRYTQTVEKPFHISQAAMDTSTGDSEVCQVMVVVDGKNFLVCTLQKNKVIQTPLDLYFKTGNVVSFLTNGKCNVHLTGYLDPEFDDDLSEADEEEEDEAPELVPVKGKRKLDAAAESSSKKLKQETKKLLNAAESEDSDDEEEAEEEEDSSDGEEDDLQKLLDGDVDSDENDDSFRPNSTGADSEEDSDEEGDTTVNTTSEADTSKEEPKKLSKSQKKRLKKQQKKEQEAKPQTNGVDKKAKKEKEQPQKKGKEGKEPVADTKPTTDKREKKTVSGGVFIEDLKVGSGPAAKAGKEVEVYYEGRLKQNNKMFDHCNKGPGFRFRLGHKEVISGWDVGVAGMKVGGKRKIICPPAMGYGTKGMPPSIPPNSTLVFEVELKKVK